MASKSGSQTITSSASQTRRLGMELGKSLQKGIFQHVLCLYGNLGAGKTTFVKGLAQGLGIKSRIQSPTFIYQRVHRGKKKLYHFDCYRMTKPNQLFLTELMEVIAKDDGVVVIEWSENICGFLSKFFSRNRMDITFEYIDEEKRCIKIDTI